MINKIILKDRLEELFYVGSHDEKSYERMLKKAVKHYDEQKENNSKVDSEICELANLMFSKEDISKTYKELLEIKNSIESKKRQLLSYANNMYEYSNCLKVAKKEQKKHLEVKINTARFYYEKHLEVMETLKDSYENFGDYAYGDKILRM